MAIYIFRLLNWNARRASVQQYATLNGTGRLFAAVQSSTVERDDVQNKKLMFEISMLNWYRPTVLLQDLLWSRWERKREPSSQNDDQFIEWSPLTADGFISEKIDYSFILILRLRCVSQSMMDVYFAMAWKKNKRVHQLVDSMLVAVRGPFVVLN